MESSYRNNTFHILVCTLHYLFLSPTGISWWSCEHANVCFHVLQAYKNNKAYVKCLHLSLSMYPICTQIIIKPQNTHNSHRYKIRMNKVFPDTRAHILYIDSFSQTEIVHKEVNNISRLLAHTQIHFTCFISQRSWDSHPSKVTQISKFVKLITGLSATLICPKCTEDHACFFIGMIFVCIRGKRKTPQVTFKCICSSLLLTVPLICSTYCKPHPPGCLGGVFEHN